jgi:dTDP-glucose pyrophosphorylase
MENIDITPDATIKEAMEALDKTAQKLLLVVDETETLIGTLTDGDIRRYILKGGELSGTIQNAYKTNPICVSKDDFDLDSVKNLLVEKAIGLIPILDEQDKAVDFITWEKIFEGDRKPDKQKLDIPTVIMAGGKGTRLEPFTKVLPKPLIPIGDKPVIEHIIDKFRNHGISEFYLTIQHMSKILRAYFEERDPDYFLGFAEEDEPKGTAGSLKLLADKLKTPFFVSNCDIVIEADYTDIYNFHRRKNYEVTLVASAKQFNIPYGICDLNGDGSLKRIKEKPEYNFLVNTGLYILNPEVLEFIPDNQLFHITNLIQKTIENNGTIGVYPVSENAWIDVGQWAEYKRASKIFENV